MLVLTALLALLGAGHASLQAIPGRFFIAAPSSADRRVTTKDRWIFNAKRSTHFIEELKSFLNLLPENNEKGKANADVYARLIETFTNVASQTGVAATPSGNLVDLAYDWIDQGEWKYFVRLEVDFDAFEALFESAWQNPLYRDVIAACLIYGGEGVFDFKAHVPNYIDQAHDQQAFQAAKFESRDKKQVRWAYRLAAQQVDLRLARYRPALAYLQNMGIDGDSLERSAAAEPNPQLKSILLHFAELMRREKRADHSDDLQLRIAILLSDVKQEFPAVVTAVLRAGERNKQVFFDQKSDSFDADATAFRFLIADGE